MDDDNKSTQDADGYYGEDDNDSGEIDLSFLDDKDEQE
jgi:hypothetical protein